MYLTGFADEAALGIDGQIKATKELGWKNIESRNISGKNIHNISDQDFDIVYGKLQDAGVSINCFGSEVSNWGKSIEDPFDITLEEIKRAIPRMKKLKTKMIRIMSYKVRYVNEEPVDQMEEERFRRLREIHKIFSAEGIMPLHENCMNYGGMGWKYTLKLLENVPGLKLVFDTGNPVISNDFSKPKPYPRQSSWEFYTHVKDHVEYIHIKDAIWDAQSKKITYTYPGEGQGDVVKTVSDAIKNGYKGGISIEPHLATIFHDKTVKPDEAEMYNSYLKYGKMMEKIIINAGGKLD